MRIERYLVAVACAILQAAAPVFSSEEPVAALDSRVSENEPASALESDARNQEPVNEATGLRGPSLGTMSGLFAGLTDAVSTSEESRRKRKLTVKIEKATNLKAKLLSSSSSADTYVKVKVYKEKWGPDKPVGSYETKVVEGLNPVFDEEFEFDLPQSNPLGGMAMDLMVVDKKAIDGQMGHVTITLDGMRIGPTPLEVEKTLKGRIHSNKGEIYLSLALEN